MRTLLSHGEYTSTSFPHLRAGSARRPVEGPVRRHAYADYWRHLLQEARAAGEIPAERDLSLARMFLLGALNWSVEWYDPEKGALDDFAREAAETFLHGILAPPGAAPGQGRGRGRRAPSRGAGVVRRER